VPTHADNGPDSVIETMTAAAKEAAGQAGVKLSQVDYVGIGAPGPIDFSRGVVRKAPNLKGWDGEIALQSRIAEALGRPAMLENDGNAAALGEFWAGAGRDAGTKVDHLVMLTLGTGIGCGIIVNGQVLHGAQGAAAEAGHMIVVPNGRRCACGQRGCFETYASASRTGHRAAEAIAAGEKSSLKSHLDDGEEVNAKVVFDHAKAGDALARRIVEETVQILAVGCVTLCRLFDPQMIVFAGGMILAGDYLFEQLRAEFARQTWNVLKDQVQIVPSKLGNDAGFIGAAAVAWAAHQR
jgi:glucokinase